MFSLGLVKLEHDTRKMVLLNVLANSGEVKLDLYPELLQELWLSDARQLQDVRGFDSTVIL